MRTPSLRFRWIVPTTHTDGTPITNASAMTYRLYEEGELAVDNIAFHQGEGTEDGQADFELLMTDKEQGAYSYEMTAVLYGLESPKSNPVTVNFSQPAAPTNLTVEIFDAGE